MNAPNVTGNIREFLEADERLVKKLQIEILRAEALRKTRQCQYCADRQLLFCAITVAAGFAGLLALLWFLQAC